MAERELLVRIVGDDRDLQRALTNTDRRLTSIDSRTQTFGKNVSRAFGAAGIAVGASSIFAALQRSVQSASDLNEQIAKSRQVFGDSSREVEAWAQTTADSFGITERAALTATGTFGNLFRTVGLVPAAAADMSRELVELAGDLASFNNADISDVLLAIRSGLIGEAEPLRRYGVLLAETRVQQVAMANSGKQNVKELTNQEKALARYRIILQDTVSAQGDFSRTQESLANQSRVLAANIEELEANIGGALIPALTAATGAANDLFGAFEQLGGVDVGGGLDVGDLAGYIGGWKTINFLIDEAKGGIDDVKAASLGLPGGVQPGVGGAQRAALRGQRVAQEQQARTDAASAQAGNAAIARIQRQASAQRSLNQQLADSERRASHLRDLIREDPENLRLQQRLADEIRLQGRLREQQTNAAKENAASARDAVVAAKAEAAAIAEARKEREKAAAEARRSRAQGSQFEALGLTEEGDRRAPGVTALRRRLGTIRQSIDGTVLDTKKTNQQLDAISKVLSGKFGKVGKEVREAILAMFGDITGALDQGTDDLAKGPLTKTTGLNTKKVLAGLGLSEEEINALRGRLSNFNSAGRAIAPGQRGGRIREGGFGNNPIMVENYVTVEIDGKKVAGVITKEQQKAGKRNPQQKRGPNRIGGR